MHIHIIPNHYNIHLFQKMRVKMEIYVWLEEVGLKDELKYALMEYGEQYVMMSGTIMMPK